MEEIWKDIEGYEGEYQVSNLGRVRSLDKKVKCRNNHFRIKRGKILIAENMKGYLAVSLSSNNIKKVQKVHILVAESFIEHSKNENQVNHINGIKTDNRVENLEWVTCKENLMHAWKNELNKRGEPKEIFQYDKLGNIINIYESAKEASRRTGIDHANICRCANRKKYCKTAGGYAWRWGKSISEIEKNKGSK